MRDAEYDQESARPIVSIEAVSGRNAICLGVSPGLQQTLCGIRAASRIKQCATIFQNEQCQKKDAHAIVGTNQTARTKKSGCNWSDTFVFKHTSKACEDNNGTAIVAIQIEETKELNCVLKEYETRSHHDILSRRSNGHRRRNNAECDIDALEKDTYSYKGKEMTFIG